MFRTNLSTLKRAIDRRIAKAFPVLETPSGGTIYAFKKPIDLLWLAEIHTGFAEPDDEKLRDELQKSIQLELTRRAIQFAISKKFGQETDDGLDEDEPKSVNQEHEDVEADYFVSEEEDVSLTEHAEAAIDRLLPAEPLISADWSGVGLVGGYLSIGLVDHAPDRYLVLVDQEEFEEPKQLLAMLEPRNDPEVVSAFVEHCIGANGQPYGWDLFGNLPSSWHNYHPELLSRTTVRNALWRFMTEKDRLGLLVDAVPYCEYLPAPIEAIYERGEAAGGLRCTKGDALRRGMAVALRLLSRSVLLRERTNRGRIGPGRPCGRYEFGGPCRGVAEHS